MRMISLFKIPLLKISDIFGNPRRQRQVIRYFISFLRTRYIGVPHFCNQLSNFMDFMSRLPLFNLTIHLLNALLVYLLILLTFRTPFLKGSSLKKSSNLIALFSALLFVSHPLQTEAVTYIYQRLASLVTFFYLFSIVFYIRWRLCLDDQNSPISNQLLFHSISYFTLLCNEDKRERPYPSCCHFSL